MAHIVVLLMHNTSHQYMYFVLLSCKRPPQVCSADIHEYIEYTLIFDIHSANNLTKLFLAVVLSSNKNPSIG